MTAAVDTDITPAIDRVECALGVIMERYGCDVSTARSVLDNLARGAHVDAHCTASWLIRFSTQASGSAVHSSSPRTSRRS